MSSPLTNVAIIGAAGHIGSHFTSSLLETGKHKVVAITRADSAKTFPAGVTVAKVDYEDQASLVSALKSHEIQFLAVTLGVRAHDVHGKIVNAAIEAGVKWIMPNLYGMDFTDERFTKGEMDGDGFSERFRAQVAEIERIVSGSNGRLNWIGMVCGFWYEWSLGLGEPWYGIDIKNRTATFFDDGKTLINTSTWRLCGEALAALLSLPESELSDWKGKPLYISSFFVSQRDMLDSLHRVLGTSDADWTITYENAEARYKRGIKLLSEGQLTGLATAMYARNFYKDGVGQYEEKLKAKGKKLDNERLGLKEENLDEATRRTVEMVDGGFSAQQLFAQA